MICNDYEFELIRQKTGLDEDAVRRQGWRADRHKRGKWLPDSATGAAQSQSRRAAAPDRRSDRRRRRVPRRLLKGLAVGAPLKVCAQLGSVAATYALEHLGGQSHAYTWAEFSARYEAHFGQLTTFEARGSEVRRP